MNTFTIKIRRAVDGRWWLADANKLPYFCVGNSAMSLAIVPVMLHQAIDTFLALRHSNEHEIRRVLRVRRWAA